MSGVVTVGGSENNSLMLLLASKKKHEIKAFLRKKTFLKGTPKAEKAVKSTDRRLTIPKTKKTARKPGQRKRVKCSKTKKC